MAKAKTLPPRSKVAQKDTWDLSILFNTDAAWQRGYKKLEKMVPGYEKFRGKLGTSAQTVRKCFDFDVEFELLGERLGSYAFLKASEDIANSTLAVSSSGSISRAWRQSFRAWFESSRRNRA